MPETGWAIVNNEPLEILAETGALGFAAFLFFLVTLALRTIQTIAQARDPFLRTILIGLLSASVGIFIQYQTFSTLYIFHIWFLIGLMVACMSISRETT